MSARLYGVKKTGHFKSDLSFSYASGKPVAMLFKIDSTAASTAVLPTVSQLTSLISADVPIAATADWQNVRSARINAALVFGDSSNHMLNIFEEYIQEYY